MRHFYISFPEKLKHKAEVEMLVKKTYSSRKPAPKGNCICVRHFQENDFANFHQYNAGFVKNALSVLCLV